MQATVFRLIFGGVEIPLRAGQIDLYPGDSSLVA
jgi:hypothetical protein